MYALRPFGLACAIALSLFGCSGGAEGTSGDDQNVTAAATTSRLTPKAKELWDIHVNNVAGSTRLQDGCRPQEASPPADVPYKGVIILFHGFTACPQQFTELSTTLAAAGYEVLIPLLPGHGHVASTVQTTIFGHAVGSERIKDDIIDLPTVKARNRYRDFALSMNEIARAATGTKMVGGVSVGGAIAARAAIEAPDLYERSLLISPFFQATNLFLRDSIYVADHLDPSFRVSWGAGCLAERTQLVPGPRAGICQFTIDNVQATIQFGQETLAQIRKLKHDVQIVGVEGDIAADDAAQGKAVKALPAGLARACYYRKPAAHSLLSRYDNPGNDKFWVNPALAASAAYLTEGTPFPTTGASSEKPYPRCSTDG